MGQETKIKLTVDYFLHPAVRGKKMNACIRRFDIKGYVIWYTLLEQLASAPNHFMDVTDEDYLLEVCDYCNVDEKQLRDFMDWITLKDWNMFDEDLWNLGVIYSPKLTNDLNESLYKRRSKPSLSKEQVLKRIEEKRTELELNRTEEKGTEEEPKGTVQNPKGIELNRTEGMLHDVDTMQHDVDNVEMVEVEGILRPKGWDDLPI